MAASFVREVLSATGKLVEKEDVGSKINRLQATLRTHQTNINVEMESRYVTFEMNSTSSFSASLSTLESLLNEAETLRSQLRVQVRAEVKESHDELQTLHDDLDKLEHQVQATLELKRSMVSLESAKECMDTKRLFEAANHLNAVSVFVEKQRLKHESAEANPVEGVASELSSLLAELQSELHTRFDALIHLASHEEEKSTVLLVLNTDGLQDLVDAMMAIDLLDFKLNQIGVKILQQIITPVLSPKAEVVLKEHEHLQVERIRLNEKREVGQQDIGNVHQLLAFIQSHLGSVNVGNCSVQRSEEAESDGEKDSLASRLCFTFSSKLTDMLIEECIGARIPNHPSDLADFSASFLPCVKEFNQFLTDYQLFSMADIHRLRHCIDDQQMMLAVGKKRCASILDEARCLMKEELHQNMTQVHFKTRNAATSNQHVLTELPAIIEEALPLPDNFSWDESFFVFPECQISGHTLKVCEVVEKVIEEALKCREEKHFDLAQELIVAAQSSLELYTIVVPLYHEDSLTRTPLSAALVHNNCQYLAHFCVLLVLRKKHFFIDNDSNKMALSGFGPDLVSKLRQTGIDVFRDQLKLQIRHLLDVTNQLSLNTVTQSVYAANEKLVRQAVHMMAHLRRVWWHESSPVMAATPFQRAMGQLLEAVLNSITSKVLAMEDISADASKEIAELCHIFIDQVPKLISLEDDDINLSHVVRNVPCWNRFNELEIVLNAGLREIDQRWACGQGPMANELSAEEAKGLVRALFQNTHLRAQVLSRMR